MRLRIVTWMALTACLIEPFAVRCEAQVTLTWNLSTSPSVSNYNVCWGTNSGNYRNTNSCSNTSTNFTISDLASNFTASDLVSNQVYFMAVQAVGSNGLASDFSNEETYTNTPGPPSPTGGGLTSSPTNTTTNTSGGGAGGGNTGGTGGGSSSTNLAQSTFWGVPPFLGMVVTNGQANLSINGTVGAMLTVMATTNDLPMNEWSAVTNFTLTNIASIAATNTSGAPTDVLDVAFVPGTKTLAVDMSVPFQYFRVVMPYDYVILADQILPGKGYTPRLIVVNMPGIVCDDACYVNEVSSFIHYSRTNYALQLFSSGSTIRQIANTLANSLNLDWTSASEFTYSNGLGQILATVVETEPPSSDPVAGQNPPSQPIVINF
jgi:hypothetical protein